MRRAFSTFVDKQGNIETEKIAVILKTLGGSFVKHELERAIRAEDSAGTGLLQFDAFCNVVRMFMPIQEEEEDDEAMQQELKEAFRLYDKEGHGYIPTSSLREILSALDDQLTHDQVTEMIEEIDTDGSGTVDFDGKRRFCF